MLEKIEHPDKYLPVTDLLVSPRAATDDKPHVYREMRLPDGQLMQEEIFADEKRSRIDFKFITGDKTIINNIDRRRENSNTGRRTPRVVRGPNG